MSTGRSGQHSEHSGSGSSEAHRGRTSPSLAATAHDSAAQFTPPPRTISLPPHYQGDSARSLYASALHARQRRGDPITNEEIEELASVAGAVYPRAERHGIEHHTLQHAGPSGASHDLHNAQTQVHLHTITEATIAREREQHDALRADLLKLDQRTEHERRRREVAKQGKAQARGEALAPERRAAHERDARISRDGHYLALQSSSHTHGPGGVLSSHPVPHPSTSHTSHGTTSAIKPRGSHDSLVESYQDRS